MKIEIKKNTNMDKNVKFTANEIAVLKAINETGQREGALHYMVEDLVKYTGKSVNSIKGILSSLRNKYIIYTYAGEYAFDGEIREDAEELFNSIVNNVISENDKPETNMEKSENLMMDERIVRINEIISTKLSSVSKSHREKVKADKTAAKFILENWDSVDALIMMNTNPDMESKCPELYGITKNRIDQLQAWAAQKAIDEARADEEAKRKEEEERAKKRAELRAKKEARLAAKAQEETKEEPKSTEDKPKTTGHRGRSKVERKVGDVHPDGKRIWTEYKPGKFNWRWGRKAAEPTGEVAETAANVTPKKESKRTTKATRKASDKKVEKVVKVRSIDEILGTKPSGMSEPQERAFKLFRKGYRIDPNSANTQGYTLVKDGKTMVIMEAVMNALMNRLKVTLEEIELFKA